MQVLDFSRRPLLSTASWPLIIRLSTVTTPPASPPSPRRDRGSIPQTSPTASGAVYATGIADRLRIDRSPVANLESGEPAAPVQVQQTLRHWQQDGDLAGIRDATAIAQLPAEEQQSLTHSGPKWRRR